MALLSSLAQRIARTPGDPHVVRRGPSSLTGVDQLARTLGMFSFALGATEIVAAERLADTIGLDGKGAVIRAYGVREIASGIPTVSIDKQIGLLMRLAGDVLDLATVMPALGKRNDRRGNAWWTFIALLGIGALDALAYSGTVAAHKRSGVPPRDYGNRSGLPRGIEASRGIARSDFSTPPDYHAPGRLAETL